MPQVGLMEVLLLAVVIGLIVLQVKRVNDRRRQKREQQEQERDQAAPLPRGFSDDDKTN